MANGMPWSIYLQEGDRVPNVHDAGWAMGPGWMGPETLTPTGVQAPGLSSL
jgi:hypothetical protein